MARMLSIRVNIVKREASPHYENFTKAYARCAGRESEVDALRGIFCSAKADYLRGYASSLQAVISGEI